MPIVSSRASGRLALLGAVAMLLGSGCLGHRHRSQRAFACQLAPAKVEATPEGNPVAIPAQVEILGVRVYAGHDYRAQVLHWKEKIAVRIEHANAILVPLAGVRLVVRETVAWDRESAVEDLQGALRELEALAPIDDDEWVLGLVTSLTRASTSFDDLGMARLGGRHMVIRNLENLAEREAIFEQLDTLNAADLERLYVARRQHKETVVLLHELAHTLDVDHDPSEGWIMSTAYDPKVPGFSSRSATALQRGLDRRHEQSRARAAEQAAVTTRDEIIELLRQADQSAGDHQVALSILADTERRLGELPGDQTELWGQLTVRYQRHHAITATARTLARSDGQRKLVTARWVRQLRNRMAVPADLAAFGLSIEVEPDYVRTLLAIRDLISAGRLEAAAHAIDVARGRYPHGPGVDVMTCDLEIRRNHFAAARRACQRSLAAYDRSSWAHYLAAMLELRDRRPEAAANHLRRALEIDPELVMASRKLREIGEPRATAGRNQP